MTTDEKPLEGRRVVVTRAAEQATELAARLEALGAQVLLLPLIEFTPPDDTGPLDRALGEIDLFDWLFFTSRNAVRFLAGRALSISLDLATKLAAENQGPRVAAVGHATAEAAREQKWRVDRISSGRGGLDLARELAPELRGCRVLLPRSNRAMAELPRALSGAGAATVEVVAYKTASATAVDPAILDRIERGEVDALSFASPSAFSALVDSIGLERLRRLIVSAPIAAIGPTTAAAIRRSGLTVAIEAPVPTVAGLAAAIAAHFASHSVNPGRSQ
ncbi:MAG TPA: uroporphyrinogen-III synthase [Patescibacteria group bacterium]|nr:uroporphyrinogen-III synthase [Patescibacteria group bacterium]